jgi:predicted nuclease of predicted toxin-antitoxin system
LDFAGITDKEVIKLAEDEERVILTFDRDYGELIVKHNYRPQKGIIYLRLEQYDSKFPGILVESLLMREGFDTTYKLTVIDGNTVRQRGY